MNLNCEAALRTDTGRVRPLNEDAIGMEPSARLYVLADGLGGYNAGEIASAMAVSSVLTRLVDRQAEAGDWLDARVALRETIGGVNADIYNAAANSSAYSGMATTLVLAWLVDGRLWVAHAGDSRLYRWRAGKLVQLTRDHSFSQELLDAGMVSEEEARQLPAKNLVTRALGADAELEPEIACHDWVTDDVLLLCSDGLSEMLSHAEIEAIVGADESLDSRAQRLVALANEAGGRDNVSVILVRARDRAPEPVV